MNPRRILAMLLLVLLPALTLSVGTADAAQTVYRCGNTYSHVSCSNGKPVTATSPVSAGDRKEAERIALRQRQLGREMESDRRRDEASIKPAKAGTFKAAIASRAAASAPRRAAAKKHRALRDTNLASSNQPEVFSARVPPTPKTK